MSKLSLCSLVLLAGVSSALVACGSDDVTMPGSGGSSGAGGGGSTSTLYERLGGHDGIKAAIGAIVTAELADDDIASFFAPNLKDASHLPQAGDIIDCFTALLGKAAGGTEAYPFKTTGGFTCRSMAAAHADLHIGSGTFDHFVSIAAGVLKDAGVADADITVVGGVLTGTKATIVDSSAPATGPCVSSACEVAAAGAAGSN